MSLLRRGRHTVQVWPEVATVDDRGNQVRVPGPTPVTVRGVMRWVTSDDLADQGPLLATTLRFLCRDFPAGPYALVRFDGRDFDVVGEPALRDGSATSRHVTVTLAARTAPAVPTEGV